MLSNGDVLYQMVTNVQRFKAFDLPYKQTKRKKVQRDMSLLLIEDACMKGRVEWTSW